MAKKVGAVLGSGALLLRRLSPEQQVDQEARLISRDDTRKQMLPDGAKQDHSMRPLVDQMFDCRMPERRGTSGQE